jgi:hypothetical protein
MLLSRVSSLLCLTAKSKIKLFDVSSFLIPLEMDCGESHGIFDFNDEVYEHKDRLSLPNIAQSKTYKTNFANSASRLRNPWKFNNRRSLLVCVQIKTSEAKAVSLQITFWVLDAALSLLVKGAGPCECEQECALPLLPGFS